jgi:parvulin-like peptidyl-prolyl isomerase
MEAAWMRDKIIAELPLEAEQVHLRQVLAYNESDARAVLERLDAGQDFDELAAASDPVTRGELGWVAAGYLLDEAADRAVFALQAGEHSGIVTTVAGFHIFKVVERAVRPLSPDALLQAQAAALQAWLKEHEQQSQIVKTIE